ncbi:MAG: hypothetical protein IJE97_15770 [Thermoguttaceae bacterium]|nr:hypothetical protein [Thermoguttaceae bacterium]
MRPFYPGEKLSARRLNELVDAANRLIGPSSNVAPKAVRIRNDSGAPVRRFETLEVVGFASEFRERSEAVAFFAERGIVLAGKRPTGAVDAFCVVATEPIPSGGYGAATLANGAAFLAEVSGLTDATACASPISDSATYFASTSGPFRIVARSGSGVCLLTPVVEPVDPFVFDYVERQPTRFDPHILNGVWRNEYTPNRLKCYLCYCDLYDDENATLGDLFAKKLRWDVTARDWDGRLNDGTYWRDDFMQVLTPVCCGIRATILTGSIYDAEDERTLAYRKGISNFPPLTGRAFFPFPITLEFALSWNDAENERRFFEPYCLGSDSNQEERGDEALRFVLDHPRRHFATLDDVPDVFFRPGLRGASIPLLCPVCYVPKRRDRVYPFETTFENDESFIVALETRPFKAVKSERYDTKRWRILGAAPQLGGVVVEGSGMRFTTQGVFDRYDDAKPETPKDFAALVEGATVAFSWTAAYRAAGYYWRVERSDGAARYEGTVKATAFSWTASESGDYVAYLASEDAVGWRSDETSVAFSVDVPEE